MRRLMATAAVLALGSATAPVFAHTGLGGTHDLAHGFLHPLSGLDHILAMLAVGLYAARLGGRSLWLLPTAFVATMLVGGVLGYTGVAMPMVEQAIGLSVIAMGVALAVGVHLPAVAATALVAAFALAHGHAHGSEGMGLASFLSYAVGFTGATLLLHGAGIAAGLALDRLGARSATVLSRAAGAAGAVAGVAILAG